MSIIQIRSKDSSMHIRMAHLCFLASHKVNGVSMEHTNILRTLVFRDFHEMYPSKIIALTNGVSQRRWIQCANPHLAEAITRSLGDEEWLINLNLLSQLNAWKYDKQFIRTFICLRYFNKKRLIEHLIKKVDGTAASIEGFCENYLNSAGEAEEVMVNVIAKRVTTTKRQILYLFYILHRFIKLKEDTRSQGAAGKVLYLISGRAQHSDLEGKKIIEAVYKIMRYINND